jgi:hypothetical protein
MTKIFGILILFNPFMSLPDRSSSRISGPILRILIIFLMLSLIVSYYIVSHNQQLKSAFDIQLHPQPTMPASAPSVATDPTADWITCTNSTLQFNIRYPRDFRFDPVSCNYVVSDYNAVKDIEIMTPYDEFRKNWLLTISAEKSDLSVEQWIKNKNLCQDNLCPGVTNGLTIDSASFYINSHYPEIDVVEKIDGTIFRFVLNAREPDISSIVANEVLGQILSTFSFTGHTESVAAIQLNQCCPCPAQIDKSLIGTDGWVLYEQGQNYQDLLPDECHNTVCKPCQIPD